METINKLPPLEINNESCAVIGDIFEKKLINHGEIIMSSVNHKLVPINDNIEPIKKKCNFSEQESKRRNFILYGIKENHQETFEELKNSVLHIRNNILKSDVSIFELDHLYRLGKRNSKTRPVLVKCITQWRKEEIMKKAKYLKNTGIYIEHELTKAQIERRREIVKEMLEVRKQGEYAVVRKDKLVVLSDKTDQNLSMIASKEKHTARKPDSKSNAEDSSEESDISSSMEEGKSIQGKKKRENPISKNKKKIKGKTKYHGKKLY